MILSQGVPALRRGTGMAAMKWAIIGIFGHGATHLRCVEQLEQEGEVQLAAVAEANPERGRDKLEELAARGVRIYQDYHEMLGAAREVEVICVPTPPHVHAPIAIECMDHGFHVLVEKPPAPLVQDVDAMERAAERNSVMCQVGFQNILEPCANNIKRRIADGEIGRVKEMTLIGRWRRLDSYYARTYWAGKLRVNDQWVLDGPMNNPLCHFIHEALYMACPRPHETLRPLAVQAELYRAHPIQGEDILCARADLEGDAMLCTYLSLCAPEGEGPVVTITGTEGEAVWGGGRFEVTRRGETHTIEPPQSWDGPLEKFRNILAALRGEEELMSPVEATRNVILHNNGCYLSSGAIRPIPEAVVRRYEDQKAQSTATEVEGLPDLIHRAAEARALFSELGVEWAAQTPKVNLDFDEFDPSFLLE